MASSTSPELARTRFVGLDLLRILAAFGVVVIHSSAEGFYKFAPQSDWLAANGYDSLFRICVPLFFMISGALLLVRGQPLDNCTSFARRIARLLVPLIVWSILYAVMLQQTNQIPALVQLRSAGTVPVIFHLAFIYQLLWVYLLLPLWKTIHDGFLQRPIVAFYVFGLWFAAQYLVTYGHVPMLKMLLVSPFVSYAGYFLLGGFLLHARHGIPRSMAWAAFIVGSLGTFLLTVHYSYATGQPSEKAYEYLSPNVMLAAAGCFLVVSRIRDLGRWNRPLHLLSDATFFIYFVHVAVMKLFTLGTLGFVMEPGQWPLAMGIPLFATCVFLLSFVLSLVVRPIPYRRALFG